MCISELISLSGPSWNKAAEAQIAAMFAESVFGLLMYGLPPARPGEKMVVDGSRSVTMSYVCDPDGKKMIKACADPELFAVNYPGSFNVTMTGKELLEMAEKLPQADGILLCSATQFVSFPIYKAAYPKLRAAFTVGGRRKWWRFWKHEEKN